MSQEMMKVDFLIPSRETRVTSPFGHRVHPVTHADSNHNGVDLLLPHGTPIVCPADGFVKYVLGLDPKVDRDPKKWPCGLGVVIEHSPELRTGYCHLSRLDVKKGQQLKQGQQIGLSGGKPGTRGAGMTSGAHLHWVVYQNTHREPKPWQPVDPALFLGEDSPFVSSSWDWSPSELWESAKSRFSDWVEGWVKPDVDPMEEPITEAPARAPAPQRSPVASRQAPRSSAASWALGDSQVPLRLVGPSGESYRPGTIPPGQYTVQALIQNQWLNVTSQQVRAGNRYSIYTVGDKVRITESPM